MARMIPGKTKVQIEFFKGVTLGDVIVGLIAFLAVVFVVISSLPYKLYIVIGVLFVAGLLLVRLDSQPNYVYLLHILRHFGYNRRFDRDIRDEMLEDPENARKDAFQRVFDRKKNAKAASSARYQQLQQEDRQLRKAEDARFKRGDLTEEEKQQIRQRRERAAKELADAKAALRDDSGASRPMEEIIAFTDIADNMIHYGGAYYGAVLEIPAVEFRFFSEYRRQNSIENALGRLLRSINAHYAANIVKLDRPIQYDAYLEREHQKLDALRSSYEKGMITEEELKARVEIMYDRINEMEDLCFNTKIVEPFYYIVLFDSDKRQLENQMTNAINILHSGEMHPRRLNTKELAVFLKYSNTLDFDEKKVELLDESNYAAWAMPQNVQIKGRTVQVNQILTHNMRVVNYPTVVGDAWLAGVFSIPGTKCVVKCQPMDREKAIRSIDRSLQELRGQYMNTNVDSKLIELQEHIDTLGNLLATLQQDNEVLLEVNIYVTVYDFVATQLDSHVVAPEHSDLPSIPNMKRTVRRSYQELGVRLNNMEFDQMQAFIGSQISARDPLKGKGRGIPSNSMAAAYPWIYANVSDVGGIKLGISEGVPVFIDFFRRDSERINSNMVIVGKSGSGKSYATKSLLANLAAEDSKIFVLDPENEYTELAQNLHGKFINVGNAQYGRLNPFHIITALEDDEEEGGVSGSYATHLQFLEEFFRQILPDCDKDALEYLNNLVDRMYTNHGITIETDLSSLKPEDYPTFDDLYDAVLTEFQQTDNEYVRSHLRILMNYVSKFSAGGRNANIWNGPSTVTTDENFIVFNFQSLLANRNNTIANAQMLLVLKYIDNEIIKNRDYNNKYGLKRKIVVAIDEAHVFIDNKFPVALDFMFQLAKRIRKYNGMQIVITQNIKDFVGSEEIARKSTAIINACQYSFIFSLAPNDMDDLCKLYEKAGGINENEQDQITSAPRGQAFTVMSPTSRSTFRIEVPKDVVRMFNTPNFQSGYFSGEQGAQNWEDFIGDSRNKHADNRVQRSVAEEVTRIVQRKAHVMFEEVDEQTFKEEQTQKQIEETDALFDKLLAGLPVELMDEPAEVLLMQEEPAPAVQQIPVASTAPTATAAPVTYAAPAPQPAAPVQGDQTIQMLAELLGQFRYESMQSEIRRSVREELEKEMGGTKPAQQPEIAAQTPAEQPAEAAAVPAPEPEQSVSFQIEVAKVPADQAVAADTAQPASAEQTEPQYTDMILPDKLPDLEETQAQQKQSEEESFGGFDIMALLAEQAKKMEAISAIEMMEIYDELVIDITLQDLDRYVRKQYEQ